MIVVRNSLFTDHSIESMVSAYPIGKIVECRFLTRGLNDTYIVRTDSNKYIFRIYRAGWREKSAILFELDAINHLVEHDCPVSMPIMRNDGEWLTGIHAPEGIRYGVLFTFSEGDRPEINEENCMLIGKALAHIHKTTDSFHSKQERTFEINVNHLLDEPMSLIKPVLNKHVKVAKHSFLDDAVSQIKANLVINEKLDFGFCHGDFHNFNMHLSQQRIEAFDFDCCGNGFRSYDLAVFSWNLKQNYSSLETTCWDQFLNGYVSVRTLSDENMKTINQFVTLRRIWFMGTLLKNDDVWGTHWIHENNLEHFLSQIEQDVLKYS
jgi:Ser/Thr protein kinase RdoA (MazF antagonist)